MPPEQKLAAVVAARRAVVVAGHAGDVAASRAALTHPAGVVRQAAVGALERCGALTEDDLRAVVADPDPSVRRRAAEALAIAGAGGPGDDLGLLTLLEDPDTTVVEVAAWAIGERDPDGTESVRRLAELATAADDVLVREAAVAALGALGDPVGLPAVLAAAKDKAAVRRRAVVALAAFEGAEVDLALRAALTDRDWQVRQIAEDLSPDPEA